MLAIIDGDWLVYRAGFSAQKTYYKALIKTGGYEISLNKENKLSFINRVNKENIIKLYRSVKVQDERIAKSNCKNIINSIYSKTGATDISIFLSGDSRDGYRDKIATLKKYKGNRDKLSRPKHYVALRKYLMNSWDASVSVDGLEADDHMAINSSKQLSVICTIDKDLLMIPGLHYNPITDVFVMASDPGELTLKKINTRYKLFGYGQLWFCAQMMLGDSADNIQGIHGYGPKRVYEILNSCKTYKEGIQCVYKHYKEFYKEKARDNLFEIAQLLWIKRVNGKEKIFPKEWLMEVL